MNLIPFVFSFLILIALLNSMMGFSLGSLTLEKKGSEGYLHSLRNSHSHTENQAFAKAIKGVPKKEDPAKPPPKPRTHEITAPRSYRCENEKGKFNLSLLLKEQTQAHSELIYEAAAKLIYILYKNASFYKEGLNYQILDALMKEKEIALTKLFPDHPGLSYAFYKMLQGTSSYDLLHKDGYPPFLAFFTLGNGANEVKPMNLGHASIPVLQAVLGDPLTDALLKEERDKRVTKKDDFALFLSHQSAHKFDLQHIETLMNYSHGKGAQTSFTDPQSGITLRKQNDASVDDEEEESQTSSLSPPEM
jgi:hypothetical protein